MPYGIAPPNYKPVLSIVEWIIKNQSPRLSLSSSPHRKMYYLWGKRTTSINPVKGKIANMAPDFSPNQLKKRKL